MDKNEEKRIYDLLALKISGNLSVKELQELEHLLSKYPGFRFLYDELIKPDYDNDAAMEHAQRAYSAHYYSKIYLGTHISETVDKVVEKNIQPSFLKKKTNWIVWSAAAAVIVIALFIFRYFASENQAGAVGTNLNEMITRKGSKSRLLLPDGTTVVLNADSKISYSKDFNEASRDVILSGEAFFEVAPNPARPFIVHTEKADIKVLGTAFNVRDYPEDSKFETSLIHGKVEVNMKGREPKSIFLKPSQKLVVVKDMEEDYHLTRVTELDSVVAETSWVNDKLTFVDRSFPSIASELERQFNVTIEFKNEEAAKYRYTGVFDDNRVEDILDILQIIKPFKYTVTENNVIIY